MVIADGTIADLFPVVPAEVCFIQKLLTVFIVTGFIEKGNDVLFGFIQRDGGGEFFPGAIRFAGAGVCVTITFLAGVFILPEFPDINHFGKDLFDLLTVGKGGSIEKALVFHVEGQLIGTDDGDVFPAGTLENFARGLQELAIHFHIAAVVVRLHGVPQEHLVAEFGIFANRLDDAGGIVIEHFDEADGRVFLLADSCRFKQHFFLFIRELADLEMLAGHFPVAEIIGEDMDGEQLFVSTDLHFV